VAAQGNIRYQLYQRIWGFLDYFYPPICASCGKPGSRWCSACEGGSVRMTTAVCKICGIDIDRDKESTCINCVENRPKFDALRSWGGYCGALRQAIHKLKYRRDIGLGERLSRLLIEILDGLNWPVDMIVPVPLSVARYHSRGYNQSALLAKPISLARRIPYKPDALVRIRDTQTQVNLHLDQRRENVKGAFISEYSLVMGRIVLLVDDVATSGATLDACANALLLSGANRVYALTLARTI
jgi:competence protein ComFC